MRRRCLTLLRADLTQELDQDVVELFGTLEVRHVADAGQPHQAPSGESLHAGCVVARREGVLVADDDQRRHAQACENRFVRSAWLWRRRRSKCLPARWRSSQVSRAAGDREQERTPLTSRGPANLWRHCEGSCCPVAQRDLSLPGTPFSVRSVCRLSARYRRGTSAAVGVPPRPPGAAGNSDTSLSSRSATDSLTVSNTIACGSSFV